MPEPAYQTTTDYWSFAQRLARMSSDQLVRLDRMLFEARHRACEVCDIVEPLTEIVGVHVCAECAASWDEQVTA